VVVIKVIVGNNGLGWTKRLLMCCDSLWGPALSLLYLPLLYLDEAQRFELILSRVDPNHNSEQKLDKVFS
jgi:hypothetical protein